MAPTHEMRIFFLQFGHVTHTLTHTQLTLQMVFYAHKLCTLYDFSTYERTVLIGLCVRARSVSRQCIHYFEITLWASVKRCARALDDELVCCNLM